MVDVAKVRKAHVKRISSGRTWIDVLRIDEMTVHFQSTPWGKQGQNIRYKFLWNDDEANPDSKIGEPVDADGAQENAVKSRKTKKYFIPDPIKGGDSDTFLWIVERAKIVMPQGDESGASNQVVAYVFDNAVPGNVDNKPIADRKVTIVKVHRNNLNDTKGDKMYDPKTGKNKIVDWEKYKTWLADPESEVDFSTYLPVEIPSSFKVSFGASAANGWQGQIVKHVLNSKPIIDIFTDIDDPIENMADPHGEGLIRIDPLQIIVNHGFTCGFGFHENVTTAFSIADAGGQILLGKGTPGRELAQSLPGPGNFTEDATQSGSFTITYTSSGDFGFDGPHVSGLSSWEVNPWEYSFNYVPGFVYPLLFSPLNGAVLKDKSGRQVIFNRHDPDYNQFGVIETLSIKTHATGNKLQSLTLYHEGIPDPIYNEETPYFGHYGAVPTCMDPATGPLPCWFTPSSFTETDTGSITVASDTFRSGPRMYKPLGLFARMSDREPTRGIYCIRVPGDGG